MENVLRKMGRWCLRKGETAYLDQELVAQVEDPDDHGGDLGEPYQGVHIVRPGSGRSADGKMLDSDDNIIGFVDPYPAQRQTGTRPTRG